MQLLGKVRSFMAQPEVRQALALYLVVRLWASIVAAAVVLLLGVPTEPDPVLRPYLGQEPITQGVAGILLGPWQRFDTIWYIEIAQEGYGPGGGTTNFPPLYPLLIRLAAYVLGGNYLLAALIISNLAAIGAFIGLVKLAASLARQATAQRTLLYLAVFPSAFFLLAGYSESLFLLLTILGFLAAREEQWPAVGLWGALAALARKEGVVLLIVFLYLYLEKKGFRLKEIRGDALWLGLIPLGNAVYIFIPVWIAGGFAGWGELARTWNMSLAPPWVSLGVAIQTIFTWPLPFLFLVDLATTLGFFLLAFWTLRHLPKVYSFYMVTLLLTFLVWFRPALPLVSMTRHAITLFPGFIGLATLASGRWQERLVLIFFIILQTYFLALFAIWEWVG